MFGLFIAGLSALLMWWVGAPGWAILAVALIMDGLGAILWQVRHVGDTC